jgi:hypothetical protein
MRRQAQQRAYSQGVTMMPGTGGFTVSLGGELGGLGAGYHVRTLNGRVNSPF